MPSVTQCDRKKDLVACCSCNKVRFGLLDFRTVPEVMIGVESFSHTFCPECAEKRFGIERPNYSRIVTSGWFDSAVPAACA